MGGVPPCSIDRLGIASAALINTIAPNQLTINSDESPYAPPPQWQFQPAPTPQKEIAPDLTLSSNETDSTDSGFGCRGSTALADLDGGNSWMEFLDIDMNDTTGATHGTC